MSTRDKIKPLDEITENDLRQTASIFGSFILADRKHKFKNRREMTNFIIIGPVCPIFYIWLYENYNHYFCDDKPERNDHRMEYIKCLLQDCPAPVRELGKFQINLPYNDFLRIEFEYTQVEFPI